MRSLSIVSTSQAAALFLGLTFLSTVVAHGQTRDLLEPAALGAFKETRGWRVVSSVEAVPGAGELKVEGEGLILVNSLAKDTKVPYLFTREEFGDVRVELEFMIPKNSNAGVYLQGRYEVQIFDSHGKDTVSASDLGGIYQRWDPSRGKGKEGFDGIAPRTNAARAPGEWQTFDIVFRAPQLDGEGKKITNARFERVTVNGTVVQENAEATGPTRAAPLSGEAATGPIAIQGDHGPIAIRSYRVTPLE